MKPMPSDALRHQAHFEACIEACETCASVCLNMALNHCLEIGGEHIRAPHLKLMIACAEMCRTSVAMMTIDTPFHVETCSLCATICEDCAADCRRVGNMEACVAACANCAEHCRRMSAGGPH
jgi:hypothetical protein